MDVVEVLYESDHTTVSRIEVAPATTVVSKQHSGREAGALTRHEVSVLDRLTGVAGVPQVVGVASEAGEYRMRDVGGVPLAALVEEYKQNPGYLIKLALKLAEIVADVHRCGVVHKDINPSNIVIGVPSGEPMLIDFDLATTVAEERPAFTHENDIVGTLAYIAPEQTGRTGRPIDHRADLYALGATLYELAVGTPPFGQGDALELVHRHLAGVPVPPAALVQDLPRGLSDIILRLLEKEPDQRYQSADGLVFDLRRLRAALDRGDREPPPQGERDFALRLSPPSRLVGREADLARVRAAFAAASGGSCAGLLIAGAPGVGKTALVNELRPLITAEGGLFVLGKSDQYRRDAGSDAIRQALRPLVRLLLAESDAALDALRRAMRSVVGADLALVADFLPELGALLGVVPEPATGDAAEVTARLIHGCLGVVRTVVSADRPVVLVLDDLQWAGTFPLGMLDALVTDTNLPGLLVIGAYRDGEVGPTHPLDAMRQRWARIGTNVQELSLENLSGEHLAVFLAEMLRLPPSPAARLAGTLGPRSGGNPYDTVELINALRRDGTLTLGPDGWTWDESAVRTHIGSGDVLDFVAARIQALPEQSQRAIRVLACLGGAIDPAVLQTAIPLTPAGLDQVLLPALEDGLLVLEQGTGAVQFRHDRVREAAYASMADAERRSLRLAVARALATPAGDEGLAAQQYLPVVEEIRNAGECLRVAALFHSAAMHLRVTDAETAQRLLAAASTLLRRAAAETSDKALEVDIAWHTVLISLGKHDDADEVYLAIEGRCEAAEQLVPAAVAQIGGLTNRSRQRDALRLGTTLLAQLGAECPEDLTSAVTPRIDDLVAWVSQTAETSENRPELSDPTVRSVAALLDCLLSPAFFCDWNLFVWLVLESQRLWATFGPCAELFVGLGRIPTVILVMREDYATAYTAARYLLSTGAKRGYHRATALVRLVFSAFTQHWFEPLEDTYAQITQAREDLLRTGDHLFVVYSFDLAMAVLVDCAPSLHVVSREVDAALEVCGKTANGPGMKLIAPFRRLVSVLRGDVHAEPDLDAVGAQPIGNVHITEALIAALFDDDARLARHSAAAMPLLARMPGYHYSIHARLLRCLSLIRSLRAAGSERPAELVHELAGHREWLSRRAQDNPDDIGALVHLVDAENAWADADPLAAQAAFDRALRLARARRRPWQWAFLHERAGRLHLDLGLVHAGEALLVEAARAYEAWGADAKVSALFGEFPKLTGPGLGHSGTGSAVRPSHTVDLMALLRVSQALSSETNLGRLRDRVVEVLGAMTGATGVHLVLWNEDEQSWQFPVVDVADTASLLPLSAVRYAERTNEPLVVEDALTDDRFARDPYFAGVERCALLVLPVSHQGKRQAIVVMENRLGTGAFTAERLDPVLLVAGQLAVSLENAVLYASLERKVAQRTAELALANEQLERLSSTDPLTGLANRRHFDRRLAEVWSEAGRNGRALSLIMIDVDNFKRYNDSYGHPAGDDCLRDVGEAVREAVRDGDVVARYGGEELVVILADADLACAATVAERVRAAVEHLSRPHAGNEAGVVTVSLGVAVQVPAPDTTTDGLVKAADAALYRAKRDGRNRVALARS